MAVQFSTANGIVFPTTDALAGAAAVTLMCWVRTITVTALKGYVVYNQSGVDDARASIIIDAGTGEVGLLGWPLDDSGGVEVDDASATLAVGELAHLAGVFNFAGNRLILYKNGVVRFDSAAAFGGVPVNNTSGGAFISRTTLGGADAFMEDVRAYNRQLSQNEILTIVTAKGKDGIVAGLRNRWMLNEAAAGSISTGSIVDIGPLRLKPSSITGTAPTYAAGITTPRGRNMSQLQT